tara:strand:+ start:4009 stop:10845 length:6837 start_codon:yes stop_codon:yes gene_type:complete
MSESKFLPFQDSDGDGLIDVCDEVVTIQDPLECPECTPNPAAIVPNWLKRKLYEPFLNEKICKYQVTVTTKKTTTGFREGNDEDQAKLALEELFEEYEETAIEALLTFYDKDQSITSVNAIKEVIEHTQFSLNIRPLSHLKLLYSVPKDDLDALEDSVEDDEEEEEETGDIEATFVAGEMGPMMMRIRKTLRLYNRYLKTYQGVDNSNLLFLEDNRPFPLDLYGDWGGGLSTTKVMSKVLPQLDAFLNIYGYNIANVGGLFNVGSGVFGGGDRLTEITFTFDNTYVLKKISFYTEGCGEKPIVMTSTGRLKLLAGMEGSVWTTTTASGDIFGDVTAMAYLVKLREMDAEIQGRVAPNWVAFLKKYTYPEIYDTDTVAYETDWGGSCVGEALANQGKGLGQDILDEAFGLGDAIAYQFRDQLCKKSLGEALDEQSELGVLYNPYYEENANTYAMAQMQAFKTLEDQDQVFLGLCARVLSGMGMGSQTAGGKIATMCGSGGDDGGGAQAKLDALWAEGLDDFKRCGLMDFMMEAMQCLMGGLTLEEALAPVIEKALKGMSINNFGDLFIGLPPDKQAELNELVEKKLASGDVFRDDSSLQARSDSIATGGETSPEGEAGEESTRILWAKPWDKPATASESGENETLSETEKGSSYNGMSSGDLQDPGTETRTLVQELDVGGRSTFGTTTVMSAYFQALLEVYQDNLLELVDELNKFPGAQLIANVIAFIDCPRPPFFNPSLMDFLKDIQLPFCRDTRDIHFPKLVNPYGWIPKIMDILSILKEAFMCALQQLIIAIIMKLIIKVCEIIGNALCKALDLAGDILASAPDLLTGRTQMKDLVKEAICGETADDDAVSDTIVDMIASLGVGAAAFADPEQALRFAEDFGAVQNRREFAGAFLGEMTDESAEAVDSLVEHEHPNWRHALPNKEAIRNFFKNMGNVLPEDFKKEMRGFIDELPANDNMPAHPSLCATPEQVEAFCDLRAELLAERASPDQIAEMCDDLRDNMKEDLGDLFAAADNFEDYIDQSMPPLVSDPGCDNGLMPFEPDVAIATATAALGNELEQLKIDYGTDMLGNGPREKNWGLVNMILSDTMAQPLTAHNRKAANRSKWVDFNTGPDQSGFDMVAALDGDVFTGGALLSLASGQPIPSRERGAFPTTVAQWLQTDMKSKGDPVNYPTLAIASSINNDPTKYLDADGTIVPYRRWSMTMKELDFSGLFGGDVDLLAIPDLGYNIELETLFDEDEKASDVQFTEKGRKVDPDLTLSFIDNAKGLVDAEESVWSYGFDMEVFFGDLVEDDDGNMVNRPDDNVRIKITDQFNVAATVSNPLQGLLDNAVDENGDPLETKRETAAENEIIPSLKYEFLAVDDTILDAFFSSKLKTFDTSPVDSRNLRGELSFIDRYTDFWQTSQTLSEYTPQTVLLREMIKIEADTTLSYSTIKDFRTDAIDQVSQMIFTEIVENTGSWSFGAQYDSLTKADTEYGIYEDDTWTPYSDYEVTDDDEDTGTRGLRNRDMKLGISYDQYKNEVAGTPENTRVLYLSPMTYGGNYMNPPIYIKPLVNEGWLGLVDVLFPELSPCKPQSTDLVDFGSIQEIIEDIYPSIPEDERLKSDPDCIVERPYNRILMRPAKAGLVGLITAACRIYSSVHIVKALPAFLTFSPRFPDTYSSVFASYIVENMEASFKDAGGGPDWIPAIFKDDEFWYAFLEQSVQMYSALVDEGKIEPPTSVLEACIRINDMQQEYEYPNRKELREAKGTNEAGQFQTLKGYRQDKNLEAIRETEEDAKLVLKEWVIQSLNFLAEKIGTNLKRFNITPVVTSLDYYIMDNMCGGAGSLYLNSAVKPDGSFEASYVDLPILPIEYDTAYEYHDAEDVAYYTSGAEFVVGEDADETGLSKGEEYIGFYHVELNDDGDPVWMAGEYHSDEDLHDILHPMVSQITVPIGDIPEIGDVSEDDLFTLEKYIYIEGVGRLPPTEAVTDYIKANSDLTVNLSEVYPGTMKMVTDADGNEIGIKGELGVRYGVQFGVVVSGTKYIVASVEVDALDLPLSEFTNLTEDSKLLLCLLNLLKQDEKFKLVTRYIVPSNKLTAIAAIYTDMGLLPSIGEISALKGQTFEKSFLWSTFANSKYESGIYKPGIVATVDYTSYDDDGDETTKNAEIAYTIIDDVSLGTSDSAEEGAWAALDDRDTRWSWGVLEYDDWDQVLLRNSSGRIKRLFRTYYNSREFDPDDIGKAIKGGPGQIAFNKLRELLKPAPGKRLLPFWKKRRLRSNPFNANGELCEKED